MEKFSAVGRALAVIVAIVSAFVSNPIIAPLLILFGGIAAIGNTPERNSKNYQMAIVLVNTRNFYAPLHAFMQQVIDERFMNPEHAAMWSLVDAPEQVLPTIAATPKWREDARDYAAVRGA